MRTRLSMIAPAILAITLMAAPVSAADWGRDNHRGGNDSHQLERQFRDLNNAYERAKRGQQIDRRESNELNRQLRNIDRLGKSYARDGFNRRETNELTKMMADARKDLSRATRDGRYDRDNRDNRHDRNDRPNRW